MKEKLDCCECGIETPHEYDWDNLVYVCDECGAIYDEYIESPYERRKEMMDHISNH